MLTRYIKIFLVLVFDDALQNVFSETFIWNQGISGAKNFIEYLDFEGSEWQAMKFEINYK